MSLKNVKVIVTSGIRDPVAITIDYQSNEVYWADRETDEIRMISSDGSSNRLVRSGVASAVGVAIIGDKLYWADSAMRRIFR